MHCDLPVVVAVLGAEHVKMPDALLVIFGKPVELVSVKIF
jgi:hypothetical protein